MHEHYGFSVAASLLFNAHY